MMDDALASKPSGSKPSTASMTAGLINDVRLEAVYSKISRIIVPTLVLVVVLNQLDRNNVAYAALTLNRDLGFSAAVYGYATSMFFITMILCNVPSSYIMLRVGVPRWLGFLVFGWGVVATCSALIHNKATFFTMRLLLGVFESGAQNCMLWYLTQFFPQQRLTRPFMWITGGVLLAAIIGSPLSAGFLSMDGLGGLTGWQWLFILEGIPSVVLGVLLFLLLPETPYAVSWLTDGQKELLRDDMAHSQDTSPPRHLITGNLWGLLRPVLTNPRMIPVSYAGFALSLAAYAFLFFSSIIVKALLGGRAGLTNVRAAAGANSLELVPVLLVCLPCLGAGVVAWAVAASSQRRQETYLHTAGSMAAAGVLFLLFPAIAPASVAAGFVTLVLVASAVAAANGPLLASLTRVCQGPSQAVGFATYNTVALVGGLLGPLLTGTLLQRPSGLAVMFSFVGALLLSASLAVLVLRHLMLRLERRNGGGAGDLLPPGACGGGGGGGMAGTAAAGGGDGGKDCEAALPVSGGKVGAA